MKSIKVCNKSYNATQVAVINTKDKNRIEKFKQLGVSVCTSIKSMYWALGKCSAKIQCVLVYNVNEYIESMLEKSNQELDIYIHDGITFKRYSHPTKTVKNRNYTTRKKEESQSMSNILDFQTHLRYKGQTLSEERKLKMRDYITFYELDYPQTEGEWLRTFEQLAYYLRNNIPYAFDQNRYEICSCCHQLVEKANSHNHLCFAESEEQPHIYYEINGGEK